MSPVDRADILAILEERPYHQAELEETLGASSVVVKFTLKAMKREGLLKRVGTEQKWALTSFVAPVGRKPRVDRPACRHAIVAALEGRTYPTEVLVELTGYSRNVVKNETMLMLEAGELQHTGTGRASKWSLPGFTVVAATPAPRITRAKQIDEPDTDDVDDELEPDEGAPDPDAEVIADIPPAPERGQRLGAGGRRIYAPGTRQKAAPRTVKPGSEPAWWVQHAAADAPRDGFSTAAAARDAEMRETSSTLRSTTKPNSVV